MAEDINVFLASPYLKNVKRKKEDEWQSCCPCHDDRNPSLSIKYDRKSGRILLFDHGGCRTEDILASMGKTWADVSPKEETQIPPKWHTRFINGYKYEFITEYPYRDSERHYLYSKLRYECKELHDKTFIIGRVINNQLEYGRGETPPTLYNLPALIKAIKSNRTIYYTEGEKDVETLKKYGLTAVSAGSVSDWKSEFANCFVGASEVVIIADRDEPGQELARQVSKDLRSVVYKHKVITPSGRNKGDVTDFLTEEGQTIEDLFNIIKSTDPIYASWVSDKEKINPDLLAAEYMNRNSLFVARNPGTKSDIIFLYRQGVYRKLSDTELSAEIRKWIPIGNAVPDTISRVVKLITWSSASKDYEELNEDERYSNLRNGLLDVYSGELIPHRPELISTIQLDTNYSPNAKCPKWEKFIKSLCYDPDSETIDNEMILVLQEFTGYILSPIYGYRIKMCLLLFSALGNTGKTVFLNVLINILGRDQTANVDFESLCSSRWATGRAFGKRLLAIGDEGGESINSSKIFKQMTGGDVVSAEFKGLHGFDYRFRGVIVAACNLLPFFNDDKGDHVAERMMMLNCRNTIPDIERDPLLTDKLLDEKDGIFIWALEGLQRFLRNGMRFSPCKSADELKDEYRARHDTMYAFLHCGQYVEVTGNRQDSIRKTALEDLYETYCEMNDIINPLKRRNIKPRLASMGIITKSHSGIDVYTGVRRIYHD